MKTKRKVLIGTTLMVAIGAMAGGATLTANAMGTTSSESKVRAVVGTVTPAADGKGMVSCTYYDVELPAIALSGDPDTWVIGDTKDTTDGLSVREAFPASGTAEAGAVAPDTGAGSVTVHSSDGGKTFTITDQYGKTTTIENPESGMAVAVPLPVPAGSESRLPLPSLDPEGPLPPQGFPFDTGSGKTVDVRKGSDAECAATKPGAAGVPALPVPSSPATAEATTKG